MLGRERCCLACTSIAVTNPASSKVGKVFLLLYAEERSDENEPARFQQAAGYRCRCDQDDSRREVSWMKANSQTLRHAMMILTGVFVTLVVIVFARLAYGLVLPDMRLDLGLSIRRAGTLASVTALGYVSFVLLGGLAASRWGARNTVLFGVTTVALGFTGLSLASHYAFLLVFMAMLGVGTAFSYAPMVSLLATWFPERRGLVIGFLTSGVGLGMFTIGLLVPWLQDLFGTGSWRVTWGVFAATGMVVSLMVALFVRNPPAFAEASDGSAPVVDKFAIYRNPRVITVGLVYGIVGLTYIVQGIFMVSFMVESGIDSAVAGRMVAMSGLLSIATGPCWGWLSDRIGRGLALMMAMSAVTIGMSLPLFSQALPVFILHYFMMGCAVSGMFTLIQAAGTEQVEPRHVAVAFSFVTLFFAGGQLVGPALAGWLADYTNDFRTAFSFTCAGLLVGVYLTDRIRRFPKMTSSSAVAEKGLVNSS